MKLFMEIYMRINDCQKGAIFGLFFKFTCCSSKKKKKIIARRLAFWQKQAGRITNIEKINM